MGPSIRKQVLIVGNALIGLLNPIRQLGYQVLFAEDSVRCFHLAASFKPDVVLIADSLNQADGNLKTQLHKVLEGSEIMVLSAGAVPALTSCEQQ